MIIPTTDGGKLDTDKMTDVKAEFMERHYELVQFCIDNKIPFQSFYRFGGLTGGGSNANGSREDASALLGAMFSFLKRYMSKDLILAKRTEFGLEEV